MTTVLPPIDPATGKEAIARSKGQKVNGAVEKKPRLKMRDGMSAEALGEPIALKFRLWHTISEVNAPDRLVRRLLGTNSLACIYGESGCGKSFLALDLALHIALGRDWVGRKVIQGPTLYIAAEGQLGVSNRIVAFRKRHGLDIDSDVPFGLLPEPIDLLDPETNIDWVIEQIKLATAQFGGITPRLLVVDTLARCFGKGDEGTAMDMGMFLANLDKIRAATGLTVLVVHHTGKDTARGERGSYALRAGVDTSIEVFGRSSPRSVSVRKQKDGEAGPAFTFTLETEEIGADEDGVVITSCVVVPSDEMPAHDLGRRKTKMSAVCAAIFDALREAIDRDDEPAPPSDYIPRGVMATTVGKWEACAYGRQISKGKVDARRMAFSRASTRLIANGDVGAWQDRVWIARKP